MRTSLVLLALVAAASPFHARAAAAEPGQVATAETEICIAIDAPHDTLSLEDRRAAVLLLTMEFDLAGWRVVAEGCTHAYTVSHVRLGDTIVVTVSGPAGRREGAANGLDDLPPLYNQMVRSIVSGLPMIGFNVIDRTNVTGYQSSPRRVDSPSFGYARLGYGGTFAEGFRAAPALGFGYRVELDALAVDVSFFNTEVRTNAYAESRNAWVGSWLKLEALRFTRPTANRSAYFGGGLSWGFANVSRRDSGPYSFSDDWTGSGLQGELTAGYTLPRASTLRVFVQLDATVPFYTVSSETMTYTRSTSRIAPVTTVAHRYMPSVVVSVGVGRQRHRSGG